jgi:hypothetical protein
MAKSAKKIKKSRLYPWFALLEMELSKGEHETPETPKGKRGRPSSGLVRKKIGLYQTEDQLQMMDSIIQMLEERLGRKISRGTFISFLTVRLMILLDSQAGPDGKVEIPEDIKSLTGFAEWLESIE